MSSYKYASVLAAQNDGKPPNDNIEKGDKILKPGKHETDSIEYLDDENGMHVIEFESVAVYESDTKMNESQAHELAKERWFENNG